MQSDGGAVGAGGETGYMALQAGQVLAAAAAQSDCRMLVRVTVEMLLRNGLRVSEFTGLRAPTPWSSSAPGLDCVSLRQAPRGRYPPLHPSWVTLIDSYRAAHVRHDRTRAAFTDHLSDSLPARNGE